jgi:hypothetical protein
MGGKVVVTKELGSKIEAPFWKHQIHSRYLWLEKVRRISNCLVESPANQVKLCRNTGKRDAKALMKQVGKRQKAVFASNFGVKSAVRGELFLTRLYLRRGRRESEAKSEITSSLQS